MDPSLSQVDGLVGKAFPRLRTVRPIGFRKCGSVDPDRLTTDVGSIGAGKKDDRLTNVGRNSDAPQWGCRTPYACVVATLLLGSLDQNCPRGDAIYADTIG